MAVSLFDLLEGRSLIKQAKTALLRRLADNPRGFEPLTQHSPDMQEELLSQRADKEGPHLPNGVIHDYIKRRKSSAGTSIVKGMPRLRVPNEYLASKVGKAIGAPVGEVKKNSDHEIEMPQVQGMNANDPSLYNQDWDHPLRPEHHHLLKGSKKLGLMDYLTGNNDRGQGHNYMIPTDDKGNPKNEVRGIDHEFTFNDPEPSRYGHGPFSDYWIPPDRGTGEKYQHGFTKDELNKLRPQLDALRPEFEQHDSIGGFEMPGGRVHADMMAKFDNLIKTAKPVDPATGYPKGFNVGVRPPMDQSDEREPEVEPEPEEEEKELTPRQQRLFDAIDHIRNPDVMDSIRQKNRPVRRRR